MVPPVSVTRFHVDAPSALVPGAPYQIVDDLAGADASSLEWNAYRAGVDRELQRLGFVPAIGTATAVPLRVRIMFERRTNEVGAGRSPISVGVGGSTGSYGSGLGVGIGLSLGGGPRRTVELGMTVRIDDAATGQALWEGRAQTVVPQSAPGAQPALAAAKLTEALFRDFPGESGRTISVP